MKGTQHSRYTSASFRNNQRCSAALLERSKAEGWMEGRLQCYLLLLATEVGRLAEEKEDHARWSALFCAQAMIYGVVRFTHLQRSSLRSVEEWTLAFWCSKGKTSGTRHGFLWSMPRHTPQHYDLWPRLEFTLKKYSEITGMDLAGRGSWR